MVSSEQQPLLEVPLLGNYCGLQGRSYQAGYKDTGLLHSSPPRSWPHFALKTFPEQLGPAKDLLQEIDQPFAEAV